MTACYISRAHREGSCRKYAVSSRWMAAFFQIVCYVHTCMRLCLVVSMQVDARGQLSLSSMALRFIFEMESLAEPGACTFS